MASILVADDEAVILNQLAGFLADMGYEVAGKTSSGTEALEQAQELRPDLVLMDIVMPGAMDGIEAGGRIQQELGIPVVFVTAYGDEKTLSRARAMQPYGYVLKPYLDEQVRAAVEMALARKETELRGHGDGQDTDPPFEAVESGRPMTLCALGRFALWLHGTPVSFPGKAQLKPLSLLKALAALGGTDVRREALADALWPDAEGGAALDSFKITLHRLRRILKDRRAVTLKGGLVTLNPEYCWTDVRTYEALVLEADSGLGQERSPGDRGHAKEVLHRAVDLYRGSFLPGDVHEPWTAPMREALAGKFQRAVVRLGLEMEADNEWEQAADCYRRGLETDMLAEEFHMRLMLCLRALGRYAEALTAYDRCRRMLASGLGVRPGPDTEAVRQSLLRPPASHVPSA